MGAKKKAAGTAAGAYGAAKAAKDNPYVHRLIEDDDLREDLVQAFESARSAVDRLSNGKSPTKSVFDDKKFQKDVRTAAESLRDAAVSLREAPGKQKSGGGVFRKLLLVTIAAGAALALSEGLRKKVLDALFGAEEEFEYTSTTTAAGGGATGGSTTATPAGPTTWGVRPLTRGQTPRAARPAGPGCPSGSPPPRRRRSR